jgi:predicted small lipoprotein YifL
LEVFVNRTPCLRLGLLGALCALLLLSGCGRKGPLDLPPTSRLQQGSAAPRQGADPAPTPQAGFDQDDRPVAAPSQKPHFFLDWLLD